jgi:WD40 repeat protein
MTHTFLSSPCVQPGLIYSGSDDSSWKAWDLRSNCSGAEQSPVWVNRRTHGAGVTSITSHPRHQHVVVTGSYDEYARVWDMRMASRPVSTAEVRGSRLDNALCMLIRLQCHTSCGRLHCSMPASVCCWWWLHASC